MTDLQRSSGSTLQPPANRVRVQRPTVVTYRLGGRTYPMKTAPQCKVCQSPERIDIERKLLHGYGPTAIWGGLSEQSQEQIKIRNIGDHSRAHLPVDHIVRQAIIEARVRDLGGDMESATGTLVDQISFAKVGLQKVYERMVDGEIQPDVADGIAMAKFLHQVEVEAGGQEFDGEMMARGFMAYMRAMQQVCSPEQIRQMGQIIAADPIMSSMLRQGQTVEIADRVNS